jgi:hypothetical protein
MVDHSVQEAADMMEDSDRTTSEDLELVEVSGRSERTTRIAVGAVLAALSVAVAPSIGFIARVAGWGIAFFDHVSLFWMVAFLLGGPLVGSISLIAGGIALFPFDPFSPFGPVFKIIATLPMMAVPWYGVKRLRSAGGGETLSRPRFYITLMLLAFVIRLALMIPINLAYGALFAPFLTVEFILNYAIVLNGFQSFWDALIPYVIVHPTGLFKHFRLW